RNSTAIDAKDGTVVGTVDLDGKPEQATADGAGHLFVDLKDKAVVARIDARKLAIDQRWPIAGCDRPTSIALDKKARRLFVGCRNLMLYVMDSENGRVITHLPIGDNVDNTVFDPGTGLIFTSTEDAKITVMHEDGPDAYRVVETVKTAPGSKTMALDLKTHRLFVPYGEVEKVAATPGSTGGGKVDLSGMRKRVLPNTFGVLVVGIGDSPPATARRTLATTGPDTMEGMMKAWIAAFNKTHPDAEVTFALKECHPEDRCTAGPDVDEVFANTSAAYAEKYRYEPFRVMVSLGGYDTPGHIQALGVYVHPSNPIQKLTLAQLDAIYSPERRRGHPADVTAWGDVGLGGEWASKPIHAYGRSLSNEVAWYFKDIVTLDGPYKPSYIQPGKAASVDIMTALAGDPYGIGYSGFAYRTDKVKAIALADRDGVYVEPSRMAVASAKYPLQRPLYIYVNRAPGKPLEPLAREFLAFVLSEEGQQIGAVDGMLPLPLALAAAEQARLQ
ncbi:MAG: hypothetical protein DMF78_20815, partial [Acidobacteria bacterium]